MSSNVGYPLPDGELGEDEIVCQLVYLPDRPEYWQAFLGALHYMTTWRAWEKDSDKRGKDAASNWREAFELTIGCWRMTCLEQLQNDVAAILAILQLPSDCCSETDITGGDQYTDRVEDGVGNVPQNIIDAGYATGVSDWAGFDDYKCMIAHVLVNQIEIRIAYVAPYVDVVGNLIGGAALVASVATVIFSAGGALLAFGMLATTGTLLIVASAVTSGSFMTALAQKVADNHEELACAVYNADGDEGALIALNDKIDELFNVAEALILTNMNLGPTLKALYAGRYDQQDVAENLEAEGYDIGDFDCTCDFPIGEFYEYYDLNVTVNPWINSGVSWGAYGRESTNGVRWAFGGYMTQTSSTLLIEAFGSASVGDTVTIHKVSLWYKCQAGWPGSKIALELDNDGVTFAITLDFETDWTFYEKVFSPPLTCTHFQDNAFRIDSTDGGGGLVSIDDIVIDYDAVEV